MIKLTKEQQSKLKTVGRKASHPDCGKANIALDDMVDKIRMENPSAFLSPEDLSKRVFMIRPESNILGSFMFDSIKEIE
jgi:hypothetical protein